MNNETIKITAEGKTFDAYLSHPKEVPAPAIIVIHEIWGLNDQIRGVADRLAAEGYRALAPDLMTGEMLEFVGPELLQEMASPDEAVKSAAQAKMRAATAPIHTPEFAARTIKKLKACFDLLRSHEHGNGVVGILGFCFGGTYSFAFAGAEPDVAAAVAFYGQPPTEEALAKINCPVLALYGEKDERLMQTLPELEANMQKHQKNFRKIVYSGTGHGFFNERNKVLYNADAAAKAWEEVKTFLSASMASDRKAI